MTTFEDWFCKPYEDGDGSPQEDVYGGLTHKNRDIHYLLMDAFEAGQHSGYNSCLESLLNNQNYSEWVETHKGSLEGLKK